MTHKSIVIKGTSKFEEVSQTTCRNSISNHDRKTEQATPQEVIDSLSRYSVRKNGAYLTSDCLCGICQRKFKVGNYIVCLPCQHTFHEYCIENWLKWVRTSCPIDKKSVIRRSYWTDLENERSKSKYLTTSEEENEAISSTDQNHDTTALEEPVKAISNRKISPSAKELDTNLNYPIVVSGIPLLRRFCYFMNSDGCATKSQRETPLPKKSQVHKPSKTQIIHNVNPAVSNKKKINASSLQSCFKTDYLPQKSNDRLPYNWITSQSQANLKTDVRETQRFASFSEIKRLGGPANERLMNNKPKIFVRRPVTFANAFKQPVLEEKEKTWVYKKRVDSPP